MSAHLSLFPLTIMALGLSSAPAEAQTTGFAGAAVGKDQSAYVGAQRRIAEAEAGAWSVRGVAAGGQYDYQSGATRIDGSFVQIQAIVLREWFEGPRYAALGVGPRVTSTRLRPDDPGNDREGERLDGVITAEAAWNGDQWRTAAYGEYGVDQGAFYARLVTTRRLAGAWRAGVEVLGEGDPTYDRFGGGGVLAFGVSSSREIRLSVGAMTHDDGSSAYVAVAWTGTF